MKLETKMGANAGAMVGAILMSATAARLELAGDSGAAAVLWVGAVVAGAMEGRAGAEVVGAAEVGAAAGAAAGACLRSAWETADARRRRATAARLA